MPDTAYLDHLPVKYIRVNVHIMNSRDSSRNFKQDSARVFYKELLRRANAQLAQNERNWRSPDGTPILPKRYQYQLWPQPGDDGFYFHYDDTLSYYVSSGKHQNNYINEDRRGRNAGHPLRLPLNPDVATLVTQRDDHTQQVRA